MCSAQLLHLELIHSVSVEACVCGLPDEHVSLEVAGCQLLKSVLILSPLHFTRFHQISSFINLDASYCNTSDTTYSN